jgi:hypothetical protein
MCARGRQATRSNPARATSPPGAPDVAVTGPCRDARAPSRTAFHRLCAVAASAGRAAELSSPPAPASGVSPSAARPSRWVSGWMSGRSASLEPPSARASRSDVSDASTASGAVDKSTSTSRAPSAAAGRSGCGPMSLVGAQGFPSVPFGHTASTPQASTNTDRAASIKDFDATRVNTLRRRSKSEQVGQSVKNSSSVVCRCARRCAGEHERAVGPA